MAQADDQVMTCSQRPPELVELRTANQDMAENALDLMMTLALERTATTSMWQSG